MSNETDNNKVTLAEVAELAGVSTITVSRAIRKPDQVSEKLRLRIDKAIESLNYVPNASASALATGRNPIIGLIVPSISNTVFIDVIEGVHDAFIGAPFLVQTTSDNYSDEAEQQAISQFCFQKPSGLILTGIDQTQASRHLIEKADFPVVQIMDLAHDPIDMAVGFNHESASFEAVTHLISRGFRRIAFIGAQLDPRMRKRQKAYYACMKSNGLSDFVIEATAWQSSSVEIGRRLMGQLLDSDSRPHAVFCANDDLSLGAMFECQARGVSIPNEMGIIGFNDLDMMSSSVPTLSSVRTHRHKMGKIAGSMILKRLRGQEIDDHIVDVGYELQARESTAVCSG